MSESLTFSWSVPTNIKPIIDEINANNYNIYTVITKYPNNLIQIFNRIEKLVYDINIFTKLLEMCMHEECDQETVYTYIYQSVYKRRLLVSREMMEVMCRLSYFTTFDTSDTYVNNLFRMGLDIDAFELALENSITISYFRYTMFYDKRIYDLLYRYGYDQTLHKLFRHMYISYYEDVSLLLHIVSMINMDDYISTVRLRYDTKFIDYVTYIECIGLREYLKGNTYIHKLATINQYAYYLCDILNKIVDDSYLVYIIADIYS